MIWDNSADCIKVSIW